MIFKPLAGMLKQVYTRSEHVEIEELMRPPLGGPSVMLVQDQPRC